MKPRVTVIAMGGTIAMTPDAASGGVVPTLTAADLLAAVPGLAELDVEITARTLFSLPSPSITFAHLAALVDAINEEIAAGATGIVITQGTDTIEEAAFFLDVTVRHPSLAGPANLLAGIRVAASAPARGLGDTHPHLLLPGLGAGPYRSRADPVGLPRSVQGADPAASAAGQRCGARGDRGDVRSFRLRRCHTVGLLLGGLGGLGCRSSVDSAYS